jgi:CHAD domain-containing protein
MAITYSRGRRALKAAAAAPSDTALHDWRKRVKDLWYHERLLAELWPGVLKAQAHETKRLSEHLGDDHDLAELRHVLRSDHADDAFDEELVALVAERRAELQQEALALGRRVYADRPAALRRRLARWSAVAAGTGAGAAVGV